MKLDYKEMHNEFFRLIKKFNPSLVREDECSARYLLDNGWVISIDFERYGECSFSINISHETFGEYSLWILMVVFSELKERSYGNPTIANQIDFLCYEKNTIFFNVDFYKKKYDELNKVA